APLPQGALEAFQVGPLFVQVSHQAPFANIIENRPLGRELIRLLLLQIRQFPSLEDDGGQLLLRHLRLVDVFTGLVAGTGALAGAGGGTADEVPGWPVPSPWPTWDCLSRLKRKRTSSRVRIGT